jgi:hypothetical protein
MTTISPETARQVLDLPMPDGNDANAATVREYLVELVREVWIQEQGFSGKRPFGNSGWQADLHPPLVQAGLCAGTVDEDGYTEGVDRQAAYQLILAAIDELGKAPA